MPWPSHVETAFASLPRVNRRANAESARALSMRYDKGSGRGEKIDQPASAMDSKDRRGNGGRNRRRKSETNECALRRLRGVFYEGYCRKLRTIFRQSNE